MFHAHLINDPLSDPGVYVKLKHRREAILFDLGELYRLAPKQILRISHIFLSHTHVDHFIGFDHLLRICLGRDARIHLFGPPGFIKNVEGKLAAYTWNLVENYSNDFVLTATEIGKNETATADYNCRTGFRAANHRTASINDSTIVRRRDFFVVTAFLDHRIPSLAYALEEKDHINILKNALVERNLVPGAWLESLKDAIRRNEPEDLPITVKQNSGTSGAVLRDFPLGALKASLVKITPGKKIAYIADARYSEQNAGKIISLARNADTLFIEASFLQEDAGTAAEKYHLTARQAGRLARAAGVKNMTIFHISPKYKGREHLLQEEAQSAFLGRS